MRAANYNHVPRLTEKSRKGGLFMQLTIHQMHELALQCSVNVRLRDLVLNFAFKPSLI